MQERGEAMEQAMAYVCCPAEESRVKVQRYCRKIYELGYVPICPRFGFLPFLDEGEAEDLQAYNRMSHLILKRCRMVVVCGKEVTGTMNTDISTVLWSSIFVTLMANKIGGLQFGIYRNCQISSRVFHTAVAALPLTKANRSDFE